MGGSDTANHGRPAAGRPVADVCVAAGSPRYGRPRRADYRPTGGGAIRKSSVGLALGGARLQLGEPVLIVAPTARPAAVEFARERLEPMLSSAPFAGILHGDRHGGLGRSAAVLYRTSTTGGSVSLAGAESPSQLSARGASTLVLDEVSRYPLSTGREGSPIILALERTEAWRKTRAV